MEDDALVRRRRRAAGGEDILRQIVDDFLVALLPRADEVQTGLLEELANEIFGVVFGRP